VDLGKIETPKWKTSEICQLKASGKDQFTRKNPAYYGEEMMYMAARKIPWFVSDRNGEGEIRTDT
jgi:hypothetical protein